MSGHPYVLSAVPLLPPFPLAEDDLHDWARVIHSTVRNLQIQMADRVENMTMVGTFSQRPDPKGTRQYFFSKDTGEMFLDSWDDTTGAAVWKQITPISGISNTNSSGIAAAILGRDIKGTVIVVATAFENTVAYNVTVRSLIDSDASGYPDKVRFLVQDDTGTVSPANIPIHWAVFER